MSKFNLTDDAWIPCLMLEQMNKELSLFETEPSHEIKKSIIPFSCRFIAQAFIGDSSPKFRPKNFDAWKELWQKGSWDAQKLRNYFDNWKDRFNLFDDERPFYQYPKVLKAGGKEGDISPVENLMQEKAVGANATLFDHSFEANSQSYTPAETARYLIARQSFSFRGGNNYPFYLSDSTLIGGFSVLADGQNLFETLALNLGVYYRDKPIPRQDEDEDAEDVPFWERDALIQATKSDKNGNLPLGYLDYLTWQSRRIKLIFDEETQKVTGCQLQQNFKLSEAVKIFDPFKVYVEGNNGYYPLKLNEEKGLWRNSHTLLTQAKSIQGRTSLFSHLSTVESFIRNGEIAGIKNNSFSIFGVINKEANVKSWSFERLPLPLDYLNDDELLRDLELSIKFADGIGFILEKSMKTLRKQINIRAWESALKSVKQQDRPKRERQLANLFPALSIFWSNLETEFQKLVSGLVADKEKSLKAWFSLVIKTANDAFNYSVNSLSGSVDEQRQS